MHIDMVYAVFCNISVIINLKEDSKYLCNTQWNVQLHVVPTIGCSIEECVFYVHVLFKIEKLFRSNIHR